MLGLLLMVVDLLGRLHIDRKVLAASLRCYRVAGGGSNASLALAVWSDPIALWEATARKAPNKRRVRFQLGMAYFSTNQFDRAATEFEKTAQLERPDYNLLVDWGLAYYGLRRTDDALAKLRAAALLEPTPHVYTQIAVVFAGSTRWPEALDALATAEKIDANYAPIYKYRGNVFLATGRCAEAVREYQHSLVLDPNEQEAFKNLLLAQQCQSASH